MPPFPVVFATDDSIFIYSILLTIFSEGLDPTTGTNTFFPPFFSFQSFCMSPGPQQDFNRLTQNTGNICII